MPRLKPSILSKAQSSNRLLPLLLKATHNLESAQNELRWLSEQFQDSSQLQFACFQRSKMIPLQYILGSQPFGNLDIKCKKGVLIPRWETEEWTVKLGNTIKDNTNAKHFNVLDLCTGTGCIPLLLSTYLKKSSFWAVDISSKALDLVNENIVLNADQLDLNQKNNQFQTIQANVLLPDLPSEIPKSIDLITANPPYIPSLHDITLGRSVRLYEPKIALEGNLEFYTAIFNHANKYDAKAVVLEVGSVEQIEHAAKLAKDKNWTVGSMHDSSGIPRLALLWKPSWSFLESLTINAKLT